MFQLLIPQQSNSFLDLSKKKKVSFSFPLFMMTIVNEQGKGVLGFSALLAQETAEMFQWAFQTLKKTVEGVSPEVIFSDGNLGDPAMAVAIGVEFPKAKHLLCTWHLLKDINQITAGFLKGKLQGFIQEISGLIHIRDEEEWESQFEKLVQTYGISNLALQIN